jgi:hypothetical protein
VQIPLRATPAAWTNAGGTAAVLDGDRQGPALFNQHHEPLAPGHPGVEQFTGQHGVVPVAGAALVISAPLAPRCCAQQGTASQGFSVLPRGTRLVLGFLGALGCGGCRAGADAGVSAIAFGGGRLTNPNRSPQTGSSSPWKETAAASMAWTWRNSSADAYYSAGSAATDHRRVGQGCGR